MIFETKHTLSRINIIKKDLFKFLKALSCLSMLIFSAYYVYLMLNNLNNFIYLAIYSILILAIISLFSVETFVKENKPLLKKDKKLAKEKKRTCKAIIKIFKFVAKAMLVGIAIFETLTNFEVSLSNLINICSAVFLVVQIIIELIVKYIVKQIDCFKLSIELDYQASNPMLKAIINKFTSEDKKLEIKAMDMMNIDFHTEKEIKLIQEIKEEAEKFEEVRQKQKAEKIEQLKEIIDTKKPTSKIDKLKNGAKAIKNKIVSKFKKKPE